MITYLTQFFTTMKKLLVIALLCVCALSAHAIENAKCYLQHDGNVTTFERSAIAEAIEAAVKGDVLYLGEGSYPGFTLNKEITVRGAGAEKTIINSNVTISIPGLPELKQELLVGLSCSSIELLSAMSGVSINKCNFYNFNVLAINNDILINSCYCTNNLYFKSYIKGLTVLNSKINKVTTYNDSNGYSISTDGNVSTFINCNICWLYNYSNQINGTFINCIVENYYYSNYFYSCIFINTLSVFEFTIASTSSMQECYTDTKFTFDNCECSYDTNTLTTKGYLGNDGTVVGIYGGSNPYTLELNVPRITSSKIALDRENKILNVNLKVTSK